MAVDTLINITKDDVEFARMTTLIKSELDWQSGIVDAERKGRREGLNEGLSKGRNEEKLENAKKMKTMGFLSEQIQAVTGLSQETIAQL